MSEAAAAGTLGLVSAPGGTLGLVSGGYASGGALGAGAASGGGRGAGVTARRAGGSSSVLLNPHSGDGSPAFHADASVDPVSLLLLGHIIISLFSFLHEVPVLVPLLDSEVGDYAHPVEVPAVGKVLGLLEDLVPGH